MKSLLLLVGACLLAVAWATHSEHYPSFSTYKTEHDKNYPNENVEKFRKKVYEDNERYVKQHNKRYANGEVTYKMKLNHLADMLPREVSQTFLGFNKSLLAHNKVMEGTMFVRPQQASLPKEVDWRQKGAITPVKNQGHCGSCWAFSSTGALEAHNFLSTGKLVPLSEQNLIDCSTTYGNNGCQGGLMEQAFQYVKDNQGIDTEESYPYEGEDNDCRFKSRNVGAVSSGGYVTIQEGNEQALMEAVATKGPVSVAIDASHLSFQFYAEGVYYEPECSSQNLDHGVLLVGYGVENGHKYWLVKNSWGEKWGDKGYIKMARGKHNNCGIATTASFPVVSGTGGSDASSSSSSSSSSEEESTRIRISPKPIAKSQIGL